MSSQKENTVKGTSSGFTLLEVTFVLVIFGLIIASFFPVYSLYLKNIAETATQESTNIAARGITDFLKVHGRFPCPAAPAVQRDDTAGAPARSVYGYESDECTTPTIADNTCDNTSGGFSSGICIETSAAPTSTERIIIGALPFRELNLPEESSYDGYGNKITYAVTESQTIDGGYSPEEGEITIEDANGELIGEKIHFLVYSHGENAYGAFNYNGVKHDCDAASGLERENCTDLTEDTNNTKGLFMVAQRSTNIGDDTEYDDTAAFISNDEIPHWKLVDDGDQEHVEFMGAQDDGKVGMLMVDAAAATPQEQLDVGGIIRAQDHLKASQLCSHSDDAECFPSKKIAGDDPDMECPDGEFLVKIQNGKFVCKQDIKPSCPDGYFLTGIGADGSMICDEGAQPIAELGCEPVDVTLCPSEHPDVKYTLPEGYQGDIHEARIEDGALYGKSQKYKCVGGSWVPEGNPWGTCVCIDGEIDIQRPPCGQCQTGRITQRKERDCSTGRHILIGEPDYSECRCDPHNVCSMTRPAPCMPPLETIGNKRVEERIFNCGPNGKPRVPYWSSWELTQNSGTCGCDRNKQNKGTISCASIDNTLTEKTSGNKIPTIQTYNCDRNPPGYNPKELDTSKAIGSVKNEPLYKPANKVNPKIVDAYCKCNGNMAPKTRKRACPNGFVGEIKEKQVYDCNTQSWSNWIPDANGLNANSSENQIRDHFCSPAPPVVCKWSGGTSWGNNDRAEGREKGSICPCNGPQTDMCYIKNSATSYQVFRNCHCG